MAENLSAFFKENSKQIAPEDYAVSDRFTDADGKTLNWTLKAVSAQRNTELRDENMEQVPVSGKAGAYAMQLDTKDYFSSLIGETVVYPNLHNAELQDNYGVKTPEELLGAMLLPGEYDQLLAEVQKVNGYMNEGKKAQVVEEVKN